MRSYYLRQKGQYLAIAESSNPKDVSWFGPIPPGSSPSSAYTLAKGSDIEDFSGFAYSEKPPGSPSWSNVNDFAAWLTDDNNNNLFEKVTGFDRQHTDVFYARFIPFGWKTSSPVDNFAIRKDRNGLSISKNPEHWEAFQNAECPTLCVKTRFDFEDWLLSHAAGLLTSIKPSGPSDWMKCGNPQDYFSLQPPPPLFELKSAKGDPYPTNPVGTCDLTDKVDPPNVAHGYFIEAKVISRNEVTITAPNHALIHEALTCGKPVWIMICTTVDRRTPTTPFPQDIIIIGPTTLKTAQLWNIPPTPPGAAGTSPSELRLESDSYTLRFPNGGTCRNFSLEKSKDYTLHFHRPNGGSINTTPPPTPKDYTYPDPKTGPHTTKLYIYD